jgi:tumor protein p53-inducible protein 3
VEKASLGPILFKRLQITGSTLRSRAPAYQSALVQRFGQEILPKISSRAFGEENTADEVDRSIQVVMHQIYPLSDIVKAHQDLEGDGSIGKIVIEVDSSV